MKHIIKFNEYNHTSKPKFDAEEITHTDMLKMKRYTGYEFKPADDTLCFLNVEKMPDGLWLLDGNIECESLKELCELALERYNEFKEKVNNILSKLVVVYDKNGFQKFNYDDTLVLQKRDNKIALNMEYFLELTNTKYIHRFKSMMVEPLSKVFDITPGEIIVGIF